MINKHFFKTVILFLVMIIIGLAGVFMVSYLDSESNQSDSAVPIAN